jgi:predicted metal-dependent RNase
VRRADGYSAHADRDGLLAWAARLREAGDVKHIFLVHGEADAQQTLAEGLEAQGAAGVRIPERGERVEL